MHSPTEQKLLMHDRSGRCVAQIVAGAERTIAIGSLRSEHSRLKLRLAQTHNVLDPFLPLAYPVCTTEATKRLSLPSHL
jgi:hypothetical protein